MNESVKNKSDTSSAFSKVSSYIFRIFTPNTVANKPENGNHNNNTTYPMTQKHKDELEKRRNLLDSVLKEHEEDMKYSPY